MSKYLSSCDAKLFYTERDARTATIADPTGLSRAAVKISIDSEEAETLAGQMTFLLLVNITARWCRSIVLDVPEMPLSPKMSFWGNGTLFDCALEMAQRADPFGSFRPDDGCLVSIEIHVGTQPSSKKPCIRGRGWQAEMGDGSSIELLQNDLNNPLGPAIAACLGASVAFREALGHARICSRAKVSLWNLQHDSYAIDGPSLASLDLGRVLLLGTGAVGGAMAFLFPFLPVRFSSLVLMDPDPVDCSNLNRVPIFFADQLGFSKVTVVHDYLLLAGISSTPIDKWFDEAIEDGLSLQDFDIVIPVANENGVRNAVQRNYPPLMIHGTTGPDWDAFFGRHIPLCDDCLGCRFPKHAAVPLCSQGTLDPMASADEGLRITGALPFLSLAAGTMALAELTKLSVPDYPVNPNSAILSFKAEAIKFIPVDRRCVTTCGVCPDTAPWTALNGQTRFSFLSTR